MYAIEQLSEDIDDVLNRCSEAEEDGRTDVPGMTYEQGVKAGIEWLTNREASGPLE